MKPGEWIRNVSTWERVKGDRKRQTGAAGKAQTLIPVSDIVRAEVTRSDGLYVFCEDVDGYESPTRETRPDFPEHLRYHYPQYRFKISDCESIPIDHNARRLKEQRLTRSLDYLVRHEVEGTCTGNCKREPLEETER